MDDILNKLSAEDTEFVNAAKQRALKLTQNYHPHHAVISLAMYAYNHIHGMKDSDVHLDYVLMQAEWKDMENMGLTEHAETIKSDCKEIAKLNRSLHNAYVGHSTSQRHTNGLLLGIYSAVRELKESLA
jgi:hypothetical protein